jgi:RNA polymerase sigma factor (sigma-70 family)
VSEGVAKRTWWFLVGGHGPLSSDPVERSDGATELRAAVARLPAGERDVVSLVCAGLSYRQVAAQLGLADGVVRSALRRALTRLAHTTGFDGMSTG